MVVVVKDQGPAMKHATLYARVCTAKVVAAKREWRETEAQTRVGALTRRGCVGMPAFLLVIPNKVHLTKIYFPSASTIGSP